MIKLKKGDKVAVLSLSSGVLGERFASHQLELGKKRLKELGLEPVFGKHALKGLKYISEHPDKRAEDLVEAFRNPEIKGIICAIGGEETFRTAPYLMTEENMEIIRNNPKFFMGYSDTTVNHLMLYRIGINTFYGLSFLTCFAELGKDMLPYSKNSFMNIFTEENFVYRPSRVWYEERTSFSEDQVGTERREHTDDKGYILLQGKPHFEGKLIGGCLESLYELLSGERYESEPSINEKYRIFPDAETFRGAVLFLETSEEKPEPLRYELMLEKLKERGIFENLSGIIAGKPQNEVYFNEYQEKLKKVIPSDIPVVYNVNFGHAYPKMLLQYGAKAYVDTENQEITIERI